VSVGNTGLLPTGTKVFTGSGALRTLTNLYPYPDGYAVWTGDCADADPEGEDNSGIAYWEGATREDALETAAGGTASGSATLRTVQVIYNDPSAPATQRDVVAVHDPDNGCPGGHQYTVASFTGTGTADVALPYGTWTFQVPGATPSGGSWFTVTIDPRVTGTVTVNVDLQ
jgi:hypothetical protein